MVSAQRNYSRVEWNWSTSSCLGSFENRRWANSRRCRCNWYFQLLNINQLRTAHQSFCLFTAAILLRFLTLRGTRDPVFFRFGDRLEILGRPRPNHRRRPTENCFRLYFWTSKGARRGRPTHTPFQLKIVNPFRISSSLPQEHPSGTISHKMASFHTANFVLVWNESFH